jgi:lambda repressor-like predicted transcriptional regulator
VKKIAEIKPKSPLDEILAEWCSSGQSIAELARRTGFPPNTIYTYRRRSLKKKQKLSAEFVAALCKVTGARPAQLRPDIFEPTWYYPATVTKKGAL